MSGIEQLRREGAADAVVRIVLSRTAPLVSAETWCDIVGISRVDVEAALERLRARPVRPVFSVPDEPPEPDHKRDAERRRRRRARLTKNPCPFCALPVAHGKFWTNHMAKHHPGEWEAEVERWAVERYGPTCPDCGERMGVEITVHLAEHVCSADKTGSDVDAA